MVIENRSPLVVNTPNKSQQALTQLVTTILASSDNTSFPEFKLPATHTSPARPVIYREINNSDDSDPSTQDFVDRINSLISAAESVSQKNLSSQKQIFTNYIERELNLTAALALKNLGGNHNRNRIISTYCDKFSQYLQTVVMLQLVALIAQPEESYQACLTRLRQAEIDHYSQQLTKKGRPILLTTFQVDTDPTTYFTLEVPVSRFTVEQSAELTAAGKPPMNTDRSYAHSCYKRDNEGLANFTQQAVGYLDNKGNPVILSTSYSHSSLPAEGIKNDVPRLAVTRRNAQQFIERMAEDAYAEAQAAGNSVPTLGSEANPLPLSISEIRLLTPLREEIEPIAKAFIDTHNATRQTLESFVAFSLLDGETVKVSIPDASEESGFKSIWVKPDIIFANFGVNKGALALNGSLVDSLQDHLNTLAFNKLSANAYEKLQELSSLLPENSRLHSIATAINTTHAVITASNEYKTVITQRAEFKKSIQKFSNIPISENYVKQTEELKVALAALHIAEKQLSNLYAKCWREIAQNHLLNFPTDCKDNEKPYLNLLHCFDQAQTLYYKGNYTDKNYNYCLQTTLLNLSQQCGRIAATGCNDNKDRGKIAVNKLQAEAIFEHKHNRKPDYRKAEDKEEIESIQTELESKSVSLDSSGVGSVPGVRGQQVKKSDGLNYLNLHHYKLAQLGKSIFRVSLASKLNPLPFLVKTVKQWVSAEPSLSTEKNRTWQHTLKNFFLIILSTLLFTNVSAFTSSSDQLPNSSSSPIKTSMPKEDNFSSRPKHSEQNKKGDDLVWEDENKKKRQTSSALNPSMDPPTGTSDMQPTSYSQTISHLSTRPANNDNGNLDSLTHSPSPLSSRAKAIQNYQRSVWRHSAPAVLSEPLYQQAEQGDVSGFKFIPPSSSSS